MEINNQESKRNDQFILHFFAYWKHNYTKIIFILRNKK